MPALDDYVAALLERRKDLPTGEADREFFLTEVRLLKERLNASEMRVEELSLENDRLGKLLGSQKVDQADIFEYLNGEMAKKTEEIVHLEESVRELSDEHSAMVVDYEARLIAREDANQIEREQMEHDIVELTTALDELSEFRARKDELERDTAQIKATLEDEKVSHQRACAELERKHVQEKDRLKKEMLLKLRETKATLHKMTASQLDTTTKRTIAENEQIASELSWQSKETEKLIRRNDKLASEARALRRELELNQQIEGEFAKKVHVYQKTIKTLLAKLNSLDLTKRSEIEMLTHAEEEIERARALASSQIETLAEETEHLRLERGSVLGEVEQLRGELERASQLAEEREAIADDGIRFLLSCVEDARAQLQREGGAVADSLAMRSSLSGDGDVSEFASGSALSDVTDPTARMAVLAGMLDKLQTYQSQLHELSVHREWRHNQRRGNDEETFALPPIGGQPSNLSRASALPDGEVAPGVPMLMPDPFAFGPGLKAVPSSRVGGGSLSSLRSASAVDGPPVVGGPVRPWGKRSKELPLSRHAPTGVPSAFGGGAGAGGLSARQVHASGSVI